MRIYWCCFIGFFCIGSLSAFGATTPENREDSNLYVGTYNGPHAPMDELEVSPFVVGMYLGSELMASFEYGKGTFQSLAILNSASSENSTPTVTKGNRADEGVYRTIGSWGRFYFLNSFHVTGGLFSRVFNIDHKASARETIPLDYTMQVNTYVMPLTFGSQFILDSGITLGFDWITLNPLLGKSRRIKVIDKKLTADSYDEALLRVAYLKRLAKRLIELSEETKVILVSFGFSF
jgi:hypothetical protein